MVPGSTLMYGSSLHMVTRRPRHLSRRPSDEAVRPLPSDDDTPPVKKTYLVAVPLGVGAGGVPGVLSGVARPPLSPDGCGGPSMSGT